MSFLDKLKEKVKGFRKPKPNPLLASLPKWLKDPENFDKVNKALLETLAGMHSHSEITQWNSCLSCIRKFHEHKAMVRKFFPLGPAQYFEWQKVVRVFKQKIREIPDRKMPMRYHDDPYQPPDNKVIGKDAV